MALATYPEFCTACGRASTTISATLSSFQGSIIISGPKQCCEAARQHLFNPTPAERLLFDKIQAAFQNLTLVHFDSNKWLFADINASCQGIGAMVYHSS